MLFNAAAGTGLTGRFKLQGLGWDSGDARVIGCNLREKGLLCNCISTLSESHGYKVRDKRSYNLGLGTQLNHLKQKSLAFTTLDR